MLLMLNMFHRLLLLGLQLLSGFPSTRHPRMHAMHRKSQQSLLFQLKSQSRCRRLCLGFPFLLGYILACRSKLLLSQVRPVHLSEAPLKLEKQLLRLKQISFYSFCHQTVSFRTRDYLKLIGYRQLFSVKSHAFSLLKH